MKTQQRKRSKHWSTTKYEGYTLATLKKMGPCYNDDRRSLELMLRYIKHQLGEAHYLKRLVRKYRRLGANQ